MAGEMIERVARAMCRECERIGSAPDDPAWKFLGFESLDAFVDAHWPAYISQTRAGIQAMREPTEEQYDALCATDKMWREQTSLTVWQTYIDAALK